MRKKLTNREKTFIILCVAFAVIIGGYLIRRHFKRNTILETEHYIIYSTATPDQTILIAGAAEALYHVYSQMFSNMPLYNAEHRKLKMKLYKNQAEFKSENNISNWYEAFYRYPYCHQYYAGNEENPYHWMIHEATHQLNSEVAHLGLYRWLDEGLAVYFATSRLEDGKLIPGQIDVNTYPAWWIKIIAVSGDMKQDIADNKIIPLKNIITDNGGPDIDRYFNLYYLHWWTLTHFLFHYKDGVYRDAVFELAKTDSGIEKFEQTVGPVDEIQKQWYEYVRQLRDRLIPLLNK